MGIFDKDGRSTGGSRHEAPRERGALGLAALAIDHVRRETVARIRGAGALRWRGRAVEDIEISPTSLRPVDPSFIEEIAVGGFGLSGFVAPIEPGASPFDVVPPSQIWLEALHGFSWLRHLDAAGTNEARELARVYVQDWLRLSRGQQSFGWEPEILARRIISWLTHENLLLDWAEHKDHDAIMASLDQQVTTLRSSWHNALDGFPRLLCLMALVQADLCVSGRGDRLAGSQALLAAELDRQILADGCHISRDPWVGVELLLDLLPLRPCFPAREVTIHPGISLAIDRMVGMLHHLRLGDGALAHFNGMGAPEQGTLTTVAGYAAPGHTARKNPSSGASGYVRLERGPSIVIMDAGKPPPHELAGNAYAGCLSFEMSVGRQLLVVNNGAPGVRDERLRAAARATASHNTLCLADQSSSRLVRGDRLEQRLGSAPLVEPSLVQCDVVDGEDGVQVRTSHNGYVSRFGLFHSRLLDLSPLGLRLSGKDRLTASAGGHQQGASLTFAVHFHLHPDIAATLSEDAQFADLQLPNGDVWRFEALGAPIFLEESVFVAHPAGPRLSSQLVVRGQCVGSAEVDWSFERMQLIEDHGVLEEAPALPPTADP